MARQTAASRQFVCLAECYCTRLLGDAQEKLSVL